jgi:outer membrane protein OmpA-like peptidoglycan-associated protein
VNFTTGSSTINKTAKTQIGTTAQKLGGLPTTTNISIIAHTPKTNTTPKSRTLALTRANAVSKALKTTLGKTTTAGLKFTVITKNDATTTAQANQVTIQYTS